MQRADVSLHGHRVHYRFAGSGPLLVLLHGIAGSSATWEEVGWWLQRGHSVLAPDLLGHGQSAKPRGDYSLGAYANLLRDLLASLGHERATVVGHSLGGGVALQFAYQFPDRCERLVLVSSGGLGREVHPLLRSAAIPGAGVVLPLLCGEGTRSTVARATHWLGRLGLRAGPDLEEVWRGFVSLGDADTRRAFLDTARSVLDVRGQRVSATNRLYLAEELPTLLIWGERDPLIPVRHAHAAHESIPGSRLEVFPGAGHFPHRDDPRRFVDLLQEFVATTQPARLDEARLRERMREVEAQRAASAAADLATRRRRPARSSAHAAPPPR
ncbi:MAG TPA: alpha/beta fold hydrolase [Myxococcota bacterium]|jgi:pimeloyl-ACP methyl ester carboxylesterase|nr:alpha/beta fold hydrolase [Myxococcota bacterium]